MKFDFLNKKLKNKNKNKKTQCKSIKVYNNILAMLNVSFTALYVFKQLCRIHPYFLYFSK